jgi:hypothetical protein
MSGRPSRHAVALAKGQCRDLYSAFVQALADAKAYLNIHTTTVPSFLNIDIAASESVVVEIFM